jgi:hypothetical protein
MRPRHELALAGWALVLGVGLARCSPALPSDKPLGRGPLALNQTPAEEKRAAPEAVSAKTDEPARSSSDAGSTGSGPAPPVASAVALDGGAAAAAAKTPLSGDAGPGKADFSGEYLGRDREVLRLQGGPEVTMSEDANAKTRVRARADGNLDIIFIASNSGTELCRIEAKPTGNVASVRPGQSCKDWQEFIGPLRTGHVSFNGAQLIIDLEFDASIDDEEEHAEGVWIYHFEGTRH